MDEQLEQTNKPNKTLKAVVISITVTAIIVGGGIFVWQQSTVNQVAKDASEEMRQLQDQLMQLKLSKEEDNKALEKDEITNVNYTPWRLFDKKSDEIQQLCSTRALYCSKVGYDYAEFGCSCFVYQYFDNYKSFTSDDGIYRYYYPTFWSEGNKVSEFIKKSDTTLIRNNLPCRISYGELDLDKLNNGNIIVTSTSHIIENREHIVVPARASVTLQEQAEGFTYIDKIAIITDPAINQQTGLLIETTNNQPLIEACEQEFRSVLYSEVTSYKSGSIDEHSEGILTIDKPRDKFDDSVSNEYNVLFQDFLTNNKIIINKDIIDKLSPTDFQLAGDSLYYMLGNELVKFDIFNNKYKVFPLSFTVDEVLHAFYVHENDLYFLSGENCNTYMATCNLKLKNYKIDTNQTVILATNLSSRDIMGLNANRNKLILRHSEGDGGCGWQSYEEYNFSTEKISELGDYGFCGDGTEEELQKRKEIESRFKNTIYTNELIVNRGQISPGEIVSYGNFRYSLD